MKRVVICLLILAAMTAVGIFVYLSAEKAIDDTVNGLNAISLSVGHDKDEDIAAAARDLSASWEKFCACNIFLTNNEGAAEVSKALVNIAASAEYDPDDIAEECRIAVLLTEIYRESRRISLENIF